jgi:protein tyrosine phosphatase (PTP) superfamily phosphohydrolase (DUF442 family)
MRVAMTAAVIGLAVAFYFTSVHPNIFPKNFAVVDEGKVYRSGQLTSAAFRKVVAERGIKTVVDLGSGKDHPDVEKLNAAMAQSLGVKRYVAALEGDARGNPNWYVWALRIATDPANQPVLIHCGAGTERTGCLVTLYQNKEHGVSIAQGYLHADEFGHDPSRNPHLRPVLETYGPAIVEAAREGHWLQHIEAVPLGGTTDAEPPPAVRALTAP